MPQELTDYLANYQKYADLLIENGANFGMRIVLALLVFYVGKRIARWVTNLVIKALEKNGGDEELTGFMESLVYYGLFAMVIIAALGQLGVQTASFIAVIGAAGLAVGLALQGSLSNFAAGVLILILRPFEVGDYVDVAGQSGSVKRIRIFTTELRTPDNKCVIIPNSRVLDSNIVNYTSTGRRRVDMVFGVDYGDDLDQVREILERLIANDERVLKDKEPVIAVSALADSSVNFIVRPWVNTDDYWPFFWDMTEKVKKEFDAKGISIPFPQRVVHQPS
jgi:small conductance mechanosensitive channel